MKITRSKLRSLIREELSRALLVEGAPLLLFAPGVSVTAGELAASAGVSLYLAYMWMTEQDSYEGPVYETPQDLASDLGITLEEVLFSPDYEGRGPSQPHGGFDPSQVGGASPGLMLPSTGGRPQRGSLDYRKYEAALREKEMIIARARDEIGEMDIDISKIFDLDFDPKEEERESKSIAISCIKYIDPWPTTVGNAGWFFYYELESVPESLVDTLCLEFNTRGSNPYNIIRSTNAIPDLSGHSNLGRGGPESQMNQIKAWAKSNYPDADRVFVRDHSVGSVIHCELDPVAWSYPGMRYVFNI